VDQIHRPSQEDVIMKKQTQTSAAATQPNWHSRGFSILIFPILCTMLGILAANHPKASAQDAKTDMPAYPTPTNDLLMGKQSSNFWIGPTWTLLSWEESGRAQKLVTGKILTLTFTQDMVSGSGGCNRYSASYQVKSSDRIAVDSVISSTMTCIESDLMRQEGEFLTALQGAQNLKSDRSGQLHLQYRTEGGKNGTLIFKENSTNSSLESKPCNR
jgi:heat shock protein HslJ